MTGRKPTLDYGTITRRDRFESNRSRIDRALVIVAISVLLFLMVVFVTSLALVG